MNTNNSTDISDKILPYWEKIRVLDNKDKIELIALISASLNKEIKEKKDKKDKTSEMISRCSGSWKGNMSSKEIIEIINTKVSSAEPVKF